MKMMSTHKLISNLVNTRKKVKGYKFMLAILLVFFLQQQSLHAESNNLCKNIYSSAQSKSNSDSFLSILESLWKLYVDKQVASNEARNTNAFDSTRAKASQLKQTYDTKITEAQSNIPNFNTVWNEFKRQKTQQQSRSVQEQVIEESRNRNIESEEEEHRRLNDAIDPVKQSRRAIFHEIRTGSYLMGEEQVLTEIRKPFSMMDTQVTQMMWSRLQVAMGEKDPVKINPSFFKDGIESVVVKIDGIDVQMKPNHPAENMSWNDAIKFVKKLNRLSKYGDEKIQDLLRDIIPDHQRGDRYDLPTDEQWEYVIQDLGNATKTYFDRDEVDYNELEKYAVFGLKARSVEYPSGSTHVVASRLPRLIDGMAFFDMIGNVGEFTKNRYDAEVNREKNPRARKNSNLLTRVFRGGSWYSTEYGLRSKEKDTISAKDSKFYVGLRLVRTRR